MSNEVRKAMTILYKVHNGLYVNLTNRCPCACTFCERQTRDHVSEVNDAPLWLEHEPSVEEVIAEFLPEVREKYPDVFLADPKYSGVQELAESGVLLKFVAEVDEKNVFSAPRILNREIKIAFDKAGIEIPFNQIVVHEAKD